MLDKTFDPKEVEARIFDQWVASGAFKAGRRPGAEPFCIVIPPPNVTGKLHIGHALNNTLQDVLARFERMRGKDVLWQPGMDHAGIATQLVVERRLAEQGKKRVDMGREAFLDEVWKWKEEFGGAILNQQKRLGNSADWDRARFTMDEGLSRAVLKVFVRLYNEKLIYRAKRLVNWDPRLQTAVSDLEVESVETKGNLWHLKYPVEGTDEFIIVATTRPETMLGDTAVAVHPENEKLKHLIGKQVRLPLVNRLIPIVGDEHADPEKGTGAVKITPAHDFDDFEVGKRHNLPVIGILTKDAKIVSDNADIPEKYRGLDRFEARKVIVADFEALELLDKIEPIIHAVPHDEKTKSVMLEPMLTEQWYLDVRPLAAKAIKAVEDGKTKFVPENWGNVYFNWLRNIQPWCVSRQLWWGHQIPVWYDDAGTPYVAESEEEAVKLAGGKALTRDPDVLDTWFSSALWPFSTLGWPDETAELKRYYPTSVLITGFDIIFFWVARMMMMGIHFMDGQVPFERVFIHTRVLDEHGK
ncbi:MAG: valine--tRNA ligase, partial [Rhizomicrobium sp.]